MRPSVLKQTASAALLLSFFCDLGVARKCGPPGNSITTTLPSTTESNTIEVSSSTDTASPISTSSAPGDSPPLATDTVVFPDDPSWTSTYSHYDAVTLPTFTSTEVEIPTPTVEPFCMLDPLATPGATFNLLDLKSGFIVSRDNRPGTPAPPQSEEEAEELLANIENWQPPLFKFEQPAGAPDGFYDMVLEDDTGKHYVSWGLDGTVSFVDQSSASTTTIFTVNCRGLLTIRKGGASYTWRADDTGFTTVTPGEAEDGIAVLRPDLSKHLDAAGSSEPEIAHVRRLIRREDGWMPRCPLRGSNVFAIPRPNRRGENPNGCGSNNGMGSFVPNLNWGHCCNDHDNCYDDCGQSFQGCNNGFLGCMYSQCAADVKWWNFWMFPGCIATANFYWVFVSSPLGVDAFYTANKERCVCPCPDPARQEICLVSNYEVECRVVKGNDNSNCGGCDWNCGYKTHCSSGGCVCDDQKCGNTCVNLSNNPNNCGACGNLCTSGFCYQGRCYDPPEEPDVCIPGEGFRNGRFLNGNKADWSIWSPPGLADLLDSGVSQFNVSLAIPDPNHLAPDGYIIQLTNSGLSDYVVGQVVQLVAEVRLCPGVAYDFNAEIDMDSDTRDHTLFGASLGGRSVSLETATRFNGLPASTMRSAGGPIGPFQIGDPGTYTVNKVYLATQFNLTVLYSTNRGNPPKPISLWSFSLSPA